MACIIIPILVGLISAFLGYLLGRHLVSSSEENNNSNNEELTTLQNQIASLKTELDTCQKSKLGLASDLKLAREASKNIDTKSSVVNSLTSSEETEETTPFDAAAAKAAFGKKIKQDDLKVVEGIGPKIEGLFHNFGIKTWKALGEASVKKCQEVLKSGGDRYRMHKPNTWPKQAKLAAEGKWEKLKKWQDDLDGGKA
jgi:predicted flap endonuclease-1-like 5' DNA nuclease